jgi:hypothetical protein
MNYLLFNNGVLISDGVNVRRMDKGGDPESILGSIDEASICVVDVDVELASAPEGQIEKKDSMLARKFGKLHPQNEYILQDEKIDDNVFQVIGIKTEKIREIYSLVPSSRVMVFIPYAVALRNFLVNKRIELAKGIVFIDDLEDEKLITVFSGLKFSVTRVLTTNDVENILPEIKRSQIGFSKKIEEFDNYKSDKLTVLTNSRSIANHFSKNEQNINIERIDVKYPAIEGLKAIENPENLVKFLLPEEIKGKKRRRELKEKAVTLIVSLLILGAGSGFALFNKIKLTLGKVEYARLSQQNQILAGKLADLDIRTYREDLKQQKFINYGVPYLKILNVLPLSYEIYSFRYYQTDHWNLEAYIFSKDGEPFDEIPRLDILKNAVINDYFIKDKPGKRMQIDL